VAIRAAWILAERDGRQALLPDHVVVVEGGRIADVTRERVVDAELIDVPGGIAIPGLINLHNHTLNAPLFRSLVDDLPRSATGPSKVYSMLMPIGGLAVTALDPDSLGDLVALGLLEVVRSGATTMVDQFRPRQAVILDLAHAMGLRLYGAPYLFSPAAGMADDRLAAAARGSGVGAETFAAFESMLSAHHQPSGRIRLMLGPHAPDTCGPDLLREVDRRARADDLLATMHLAQSRGEIEAVRARHGLGPIDYVESCGLLRDGVIFAHGVFLEDDELARVAASGAAIANCANVFLRGGTPAPFERFAGAAVRVGIGTDAERMDMFAQLRTSGFVSKQASGRGDAASAARLLRAATRDGADILRRGDLGRIAPGAAADIVVVDLMQAHLQPVRDPLRTLVWYASARDIHTVMIDGRVVIGGGRYRLGDERAIIARGARATAKVWELAERNGNLPSPVA
jgi:cytosine/adenosine deaminase-related metal-dependent hydrolase